jgi:hypothetical protein
MRDLLTRAISDYVLRNKADSLPQYVEFAARCWLDLSLIPVLRLHYAGDPTHYVKPGKIPILVVDLTPSIINHYPHEYIKSLIKRTKAGSPTSRSG